MNVKLLVLAAMVALTSMVSALTDTDGYTPVTGYTDVVEAIIDFLAGVWVGLAGVASSVGAILGVLLILGLLYSLMKKGGGVTGIVKSVTKG